MTYLEAFNEVNRGPWQTVGDDFQFRYVEGYIDRLFLQPSKSTRDWINNFDFPAEAYKDMPAPWMVHRGFKHVWQSAEDTVMPMILGSKRLEIIGYSHGGPAALFAHESYVYHTGRFPRTVTFGSPRLVWGKIPKEVENRFVGVLNIQVNGDIVTHVPPKLFGFRHVGHVIPVGPKRSIPLPHYHAPASYRDVLARFLKGEVPE